MKYSDPRFKAVLAFLALLPVVSGCIRNDIPYPRIPQNILSLEARGENAPAEIDSASFLATVFLDEQTDIESVSFSSYTYTEGAETDPDLLEGTYDLSTPMVVTLSRYQPYQWVVSAVQNIERYFNITGQIGETVIDAVGRRIIVKVPESADISSLELTACKLGPAEITTMQPEMTPGVYDFSRPFKIDVTAHGRTRDWTVYVEISELVVSTSQVDAGSGVVWAYGNGPADLKGGFQYREATSGEWIDVSETSVTQSQGAFSARIDRLKPLTEYVFRAVAGEHIGNEVNVTTGATELIPDGSFDQWWLQGRVWCPWDEGGVSFWDTGNTGAATLGQSNVQPSDDTPLGQGRSARLETKFVGIGSLGKLAAGSIYTGSFVKVDGTNGILDFGRPWSVRPTRLRGYMKYQTAPIDYASAELEYLKGRPDSCHIYVALTDWPSPYQIRTNPKNRQLFNPSSPEVIAYGELVQGSSDSGWREFEIEIRYRSTSRVPRYMQITCAASKYGDYFTGGTGAVLYVDQLSFVYDH